MHVLVDLYMSLMTYTCPWWLIHVLDDLYMSLMTYACPCWLIHVLDDLYMSLMTYTCPWWLMHVLVDLYMSLMTYTCPWWLIHVLDDLYMSLLTCFNLISCQLWFVVGDSDGRLIFKKIICWKKTYFLCTKKSCLSYSVFLFCSQFGFWILIGFVVVLK